MITNYYEEGILDYFKDLHARGKQKIKNEVQFKKQIKKFEEINKEDKEMKRKKEFFLRLCSFLYFKLQFDISIENKIIQNKSKSVYIDYEIEGEKKYYYTTLTIFSPDKKLLEEDNIKLVKLKTLRVNSDMDDSEIYKLISKVIKDYYNIDDKKQLINYYKSF